MAHHLGLLVITDVRQSLGLVSPWGNLQAGMARGCPSTHVGRVARVRVGIVVQAYCPRNATVQLDSGFG